MKKQMLLFLGKMFLFGFTEKDRFNFLKIMFFIQFQKENSSMDLKKLLLFLGTKSFIPKEHDIYCAKCYEDKFATKCIKCSKVG
jgi:hypothetical protein